MSKETYINTYTNTLKCDVRPLTDTDIRRGYAVDWSSGKIYALVKNPDKPGL